MKPWQCMAAALALTLASAAPKAQPAETASAASALASSKALFAVEIRIGPQWDSALPPNRQPLMREHSANLKKLRDEGRLRMGARYGEVGLVVLEAASIGEARAWMDADPSVQAGIFRYEIHPFSVFYGGSVGR